MLPKQNQRLDEIALEIRIQKTGLHNVLKELKLAADLKLTPEQLKEMKAKALECSQELEQKVD